MISRRRSGRPRAMSRRMVARLGRTAGWAPRSWLARALTPAAYSIAPGDAGQNAVEGLLDRASLGGGHLADHGPDVGHGEAAQALDGQIEDRPALAPHHVQQEQPRLAPADVAHRLDHRLANDVLAGLA